MDVLSLTFTIIAIIGAILNASGKKKILYGYFLWLIANAGFINITIANGWWEQTPLWIIYTATTLWGIATWKKEAMHDV